MNRILKFFGAFLLVTVFIFGSIYLLNRHAIDTVFRNDLSEGTEWVPKTYSLVGLVDYLALNPENLSLVSVRGDYPDSSILYQAERPRSLGSLANLMLLASYAEAVSAGDLDRHETVDIDLLRSLHVPGYEDRGFKRDLRALSDPGAGRLDHLAALLAENNDATFADYLYLRLGAERVAAIPSRFGLTATQAPLPWAGMLTAWDPRLHAKDFASLHDFYTGLGDSAYHAHITAAGLAYLTSAARRDSMKVRLETGDELLFVQEKLRNAMAAKGSPAELASFLSGLLSGGLLSPDARQHLDSLLSWPMRYPKTARDFGRYAAIYDSKMGYLAGIDLGTRPGETQPTVQVFIMENIPVGLFLHLSSNLMNQDLQQRLIWDPELARAALERLNGSTPGDTAGASASHP